MIRTKIIIGLTTIAMFSCGEEKKREEVNTKAEITNIDLEETKAVELTEIVSFPKDSIADFGSYEQSKSLDKFEDGPSIICVDYGSSRSPNYLLLGDGRTLYVRFTGADWSGVKNTCGNYRASNRRFTFPDSRMYQYQMTLFEEAPGARNYFIDICKEDVTYSVRTKKGFKYYIYTNDTSGDHDDNRGPISYCYGLD